MACWGKLSDSCLFLPGVQVRGWAPRASGATFDLSIISINAKAELWTCR